MALENIKIGVDNVRAFIGPNGPILATVAVDQNETLTAGAAGGTTRAACPAATATTVKAAPGTLKGLWITGTGTAGTVAVADGGTTYFTAQVPAAVTTFALPLPLEGVAHGTSIVVTTAGAGVSAVAFYL